MIDVTTDAQRKLVIARMGGMLTVGDVKDFALREQDAIRTMGWGSREFDLLVLTEGNMVQTQDVMNAFVDMIHHAPLKARRFATVRDGILTRMQTRRVAKIRAEAEVFETAAEALAWLGQP